MGALAEKAECITNGGRRRLRQAFAKGFAIQPPNSPYNQQYQQFNAVQ
jgi:hypothetical protein